MDKLLDSTVCDFGKQQPGCASAFRCVSAEAHLRPSSQWNKRKKEVVALLCYYPDFI